MVTRQTAEVENNMNSVERLAHYSSDKLPQEASQEIPQTAPPPDWPQRGEIILDKVVMSYRPELPPVIKGMWVGSSDYQKAQHSLRSIYSSAVIQSGEKVGIVGRTGAGKSSIMNVRPPGMIQIL